MQALVHIYNHRRLLTWMQDVEASVYGHLYQAGRDGWGTAGMGGNGQFNRLRALDDLADDRGPWHGRLTEDQDRTRARGHRHDAVLGRRPAMAAAAHLPVTFAGTIVGCIAARATEGPLGWIRGFVAHVYAFFSWLLWPVLVRSALRQLTERRDWV